MKRVRENDQKGQIIKVNAGGIVFPTFLDTLTKVFPDCLLARQFSNPHEMRMDGEGHYFLDMSPIHFAVILDILRNPVLLDMVPKEMTSDIFNAILDAQELRPRQSDVWPEKKLEITQAWDQQQGLDRKLDLEVLKLILGWIDLPALIVGPEVSKTFYIPYGVYKLEDEAELALYIIDSLPQLQALLDNVSEKTATLSIKQGSAAGSPASFDFEGVTYSTFKSPFYELTINI